ncbi:13634_t:CDS:1, partial [Dentiscutata heterogama]
MKLTNLLTKQAAAWMKTMEKNLVISNEKCLVSDIKNYFNQTNTIDDPSNLIEFKKLNASSLD